MKSLSSVILVLVASLGLFASLAEASDKPNLIVIMTDDMGYAGVFRWFALGNLVVIPLVLFVLARFEAVYARATEDLIVEEV